MVIDLFPNEKVFGFYVLVKCDAKSIYLAIKDALLRLNISLSYCVGITFDDASSFSGHLSSVAVRISELARTQCHMHYVNLAVQDVVKGVPLMRNFLESKRLEAQLSCLENITERKMYPIASITQIIKLISQSKMKNMYPMVLNMIQLYLVCPATTVNAERSFIPLRRLKTCLRCTMNQRRLNALLILSTNKEEVDLLDKLANEFIMSKETRRNVFHYSNSK